MSKTLLVGDPHGKISNVKDFEQFLAQLLIIVGSGKYKKVIVLGDLFDSFAVIRSEIMAFWSQFLISSGRYSEVILIVGNHDMAGESGGAHSLEPFKSFPNVKVVDTLTEIDGVYYMPFVRDNAAFEISIRSIPAGALLICHQSFNGAQFDNGFYDPHGADPSCVSQLAGVISGHVHKQQKVANIWYPGTPYQMTFSDAGETKGVFEVTLGSDGYNVIKQHVLNLPTFIVVEGSLTSLVEWAAKAIELQDISQTKVKFISTGSPQEIVEFWKNPIIRELRSKTARVVDSLTTVRSEKALPGSQGKSQREKLNDFIKSKQWRTNADRLIAAAEECLTQ